MKKNFKMDLPKNIQLPNEIWLKIMNYLKTKDVFGNFALVCKSFNNLTMDHGAIKHIHISNFKTEEDNKRMEKTLQVLKHCHQLRSLSIDEWSNVVPFIWSHLQSRPSNQVQDWNHWRYQIVKGTGQTWMTIDIIMLQIQKKRIPTL